MPRLPPGPFHALGTVARCREPFSNDLGHFNLVVWAGVLAPARGARWPLWCVSIRLGVCAVDAKDAGNK